MKLWRLSATKGKADAWRVPGACVLAYGALRAAFVYANLDPEKSILSLVLFVCFAFVARGALGVRGKDVRFAAAAIAALFSACMVLGHELKLNHTLSALYDSFYALKETALLWLGLGAMFYAPLALMLDALVRRGGGQSAICTAPKRNGRWTFFLLWGLLLACWAPYLFAAWPGVLPDDGILQMGQALGYRQLANHHPLIHTGLLWLCIRLGSLFAPLEVSLAMYSLLQMAVMAAIFSYALCFLLHIRTRRVYVGLVLALFALSPVCALYSMSAWKDTLHGGFTLWLAVLLFKMVLEPENFFTSRRRLVALGVACFLFATFRNNGLYAFLLFAPCLLLCFRRHWKRLVAVFAGVCVLLGVYRGPVFHALNVQEGSSVEMLSIPLQQVARAVASHPDALTEEERRVIGEVLPLERINELYNPGLSDPIKNNFNLEAFNENRGRYLGLWWQLFCKYPGSYLVSLLAGTYGYWYPEVNYWVVVFNVLPNDYGFRPLSSPEIQDRLYKFVQQESSLGLGSSFFYSAAIMVWVAVFAAALCMLKRQRRLLLPFALLGLLYLTVLASPVFAEYRYLYGIFCAVPICLGVALAVGGKPEGKVESEAQ